MKKQQGKTAEQIIIKILSSQSWTKIENVKLATHKEDQLGIDMHYEWMGIKTQAQIKSISWWKDLKSRRSTYIQLKKLTKENDKYDNIRIIVYGYAKGRTHNGKSFRPGLNIYMIKKLDEVWGSELEKIYQKQKEIENE